MNETLTPTEAQKFSELFKALSNGETIQWFDESENTYVDCYKEPNYYTLNTADNVEKFRVKPKNETDSREFDLYRAEMVIFSQYLVNIWSSLLIPP